MKLKDCFSAKYSDKGTHYHTFHNTSYLDIYERYFSHLKNEQLNLLEIGVSLHRSDNVSTSLALWKEYFPKANIYGLDIDPFCKQYERDGIHIEIGSQNDENVLNNLIGTAKNFDIIIDDGSHVNKYTLFSFQKLFPVLNPGGIYVIEDLGCSYDPIEKRSREQWPGQNLNPTSDNLDNDRQTMRTFFDEVISNMDRRRGEVLSIQFWSEICFIIKAGKTNNSSIEHIYGPRS